MLFHSSQFLIFFAITAALYFACPPRYRWAWLLAANLAAQESGQEPPDRRERERELEVTDAMPGRDHGRERLAAHAMCWSELAELPDIDTADDLEIVLSDPRTPETLRRRLRDAIEG